MEQDKYKKILPHKAYYVTCPDDDSVLLALDTYMRARRTKEGEVVYTICWFDTVKERIMESKKLIKDEKEVFIFERCDGVKNEVYTFMPLTLQIFREKVRQRLINPPEIKNEEEMLKELEKTKETF